MRTYREVFGETDKVAEILFGEKKDEVMSTALINDREVDVDKIIGIYGFSLKKTKGSANHDTYKPNTVFYNPFYSQSDQKLTKMINLMDLLQNHPTSEEGKVESLFRGCEAILPKELLYEALQAVLGIDEKTSSARKQYTFIDNGEEEKIAALSEYLNVPMVAVSTKLETSGFQVIHD